MNTRLEGWKLAVAVLIPTLIIGAAIWFAVQALNTSGETAVDSVNEASAAPTLTPTSVPQTSTVAEPTTVPTPTPIELPSSIPTVAVPSLTATPTASTAASSEPTTVPPPTAVPQPAGPTATPTVDAGLVALSCSGATFPLSVDVDETLPSLTAAMIPAEASAGKQFLWNFGNGRVVGAPNSGSVSYSSAGSFVITVTATDATTGEVISATCGNVTVGVGSAAVSEVACTVRPNSGSIKWEDATTETLMRVSTTWKPTDTPLTLQYEFGTFDPIVFSNDAVSGDSLTRAFGSRSATVRVFWRDEATGSTGRISCPAFPAETPTTVAATATPTSGATATATPTSGATATATPTSGATATATPTSGATATATPTSGATATATPTSGATATATPTSGATATATPTSGATATATPTPTSTSGT